LEPSMSAISPTSTPVLCVAATVCGLPGGATIHVIAKRVALSLARTKNLLSVAASAGLVDKVQHGKSVLWMAPHAAQAARAARRGAPVARPRWQRGEDLPDGPVQLRVAADAPLPFRCTAVNSVFALGAVS